MPIITKTKFKNFDKAALHLRISFDKAWSFLKLNSKPPERGLLTFAKHQFELRYCERVIKNLIIRY